MALGMLEDHDLISRLEHGTGPQLGAPSLHPWVWSAAAGLWNGGHFREAVAAAGASVTAQVQSKVGRWDLADADLLNQVLSRQPAKPGEPRLRVPGDQGNRFIMALQEGLLKLAGGLYAVVRNPATHETQQWEEQFALEQLAALSVLARRLDNAEVVPSGPGVKLLDASVGVRMVHACSPRTGTGIARWGPGSAGPVVEGDVGAGRTGPAVSDRAAGG